jgi:uncharacterized protein YceK
MRTFFISLALILLSGCGCILSQIPPQKIYAGASCTATLPNYLTKITASDNCEIVSFTQVPAAGYLLTPTNKVTTVVVKATDASGNFKQVSFTVTLLDTIKPLLDTIAPELLAYTHTQIQDIYNFGDRLIARQEELLMQQSWIDSIPGLREKLQDSTYFKKTMLTWTAKGHAVTGYGQRIFTWYDADNDSIIRIR